MIQILNNKLLKYVLQLSPVEAVESCRWVESTNTTSSGIKKSQLNTGTVIKFFKVQLKVPGQTDLLIWVPSCCAGTLHVVYAAEP